MRFRVAFSYRKCFNVQRNFVAASVYSFDISLQAILSCCYLVQLLRFQIATQGLPMRFQIATNCLPMSFLAATHNCFKRFYVLKMMVYSCCNFLQILAIFNDSLPTKVLFGISKVKIANYAAAKGRKNRGFRTSTSEAREGPHLTVTSQMRLWMV